MITFEWDTNKNAINEKKHQISFDEAKSVFYVDNGIVIDDPDHSIDEERFVIIGLSDQLKTLTVCHCYRDNDEVIRIISARKATKLESQQYYQQEMR
jgi:uncharacterized DUF497 family protein